MAEMGSGLLFGTRDIIVEHQRGLTVLGYPVFSPNLLIRGVDPPQFQLVGEDGHTVVDGEVKAGAGMYPYDLKSPLKGYKWFVSMDHANRYDTDDQGWCYSWRFRSVRWKAHGGFVRKRYWVRLLVNSREMTPAEREERDSNVEEATSATEESQHDAGSDSSKESEFEALLEELRKPILDRQKADLVLQYMSHSPAEEQARILAPASEFLDKVLSEFQFEESKRKLCEVQLPKLLESMHWDVSG